MPRLVTSIELGDDDSASTISISARHELELDDGHRILLLDDRGWASSGPPEIWDRTSAQDIAEVARVVVGPDEPFGEQSRDDMINQHWDFLRQLADQRGATITSDALRSLRHDVEFGPRLRARLPRP
ncbi:MAG TPA: hypothetical protein VIP98_11240 [Microlunatus sp.]